MCAYNPNSPDAVRDIFSLEGDALERAGFREPTCIDSGVVKEHGALIVSQALFSKFDILIGCQDIGRITEDRNDAIGSAR